MSGVIEVQADVNQTAILKAWARVAAAEASHHDAERASLYRGIRDDIQPACRGPTKTK